MKLSLDGIRLIRFEPQYHTAKIYEWYYSGDYPEFFRDYPICPSLLTIGDVFNGDVFLIARDECGTILGLINIYQESTTSRNFTVGLMVDKQMQRNGMALIALKILLNWKFNFCNFYKAKFRVLAKNKRLCFALETFGAQREGGPHSTLKKEFFLDGEFHDGADYALFKTDFNKKYKHNFENKELRLVAPNLEDLNNSSIQYG